MTQPTSGALDAQILQALKDILGAIRETRTSVQESTKATKETKDTSEKILEQVKTTNGRVLNLEESDSTRRMTERIRSELRAELLADGWQDPDHHRAQQQLATVAEVPVKLPPNTITLPPRSQLITIGIAIGTAVFGIVGGFLKASGG